MKICSLYAVFGCNLQVLSIYSNRKWTYVLVYEKSQIIAEAVKYIA